MRYNDEYSIKCVVKGIEKPIIAELGGSPEDVTYEGYKNLERQLKKSINERRSI